MSSSLFRKEALEHRKDRLYGDVVLLQPLSLSILVGVVVVICALILAILFWGTYARKETVHGYIVPDKGIVKTYAPQAGTIAKMHIADGDGVEEGQVLITLLCERSMQGGSDIDAKLLHELDITKQHQFEQIKAERSVLASDTQRLESQIESLNRELEQTGQNLKTQQDRIHILESRVAGAKKLLDNKNMSESEYQKYYDELLVQKQRYQELLTAKNNGENKLSQSKSDLEKLPVKVKSQINEIENKISELNQRYVEVQGRRSFEVRAPVAGTLTALQAMEGHWHTTRQAGGLPLLAIIPKDAILQAELFVPSRAIGFITKDQTVRIRYDAFPYQRFGIYEGKIAVISKHVMLPSELPVPLDLKEPVYRITVNLAQQDITAYGKSLPLQAGMSLEADIILDKQTLFEWILDPIISLRGRF